MSEFEQYEIMQDETASRSVTYGKYSQLVASKHKNDYGESGQQNIRKAVHRVFVEALDQIDNTNMSNNVLLVGKVQSGKTSNLEALTALAFDNGFNLMIIYGGYDTNLLAQTTSRFKATFDVSADFDDVFDNATPVVFSTGANDLSIADIDSEILEEFNEARVPIILTAMKRPHGLNAVNDFLRRVDLAQMKCLVIDDEGDQASLNISKDKRSDASATYAKICEMKQLLGDPLYFSVTATPHANIFLSSLSALRPDSIHLLYPGAGYCGTDSYRPDSDAMAIIPDEMSDCIETGVMPQSLKRALKYFIVASAIMWSRSIRTSDMIVHAFREQKHHETIYNWVDQYIGQLKYIYSENEAVEKRVFLSECRDTFNKEFSHSVQEAIAFENLEKYITKVVKGTYVVLQNSMGKSTQGKAQIRHNVIYIGGDLLQRGLTFKKLVTTYFTRWPKDGGNMDTNLQRARWFGYRESYIDLCRVFTTSEISDELFALAGVDDDLWDQFEEIESGEKGIRDVIIEADSTRQRPTRKQAADYEVVRFRSNWIKQKIGVFDKRLIASNNESVDALLKELSFVAGRFGSVGETQETCSYAYAPANAVIKMLDSLQGIYDEKAFRLDDIKRVIGNETIPVIKMSFFESGRRRSFYFSPSDMYNHIKALHQGADRVRAEDVVYRGDKYVIADKSKVNLQIFKIVPLHEGHIQEEETQYMFALFVPGDRSYFIPSWT